MKKLIKPVVFAMVAIMMMVSMFGCYGNMSLTKKVWQWNGSLGSKLTVNVVFWIMSILPVYETAVFIDVVVLNTIEFWTGTNLLAMQENEQIIRTVKTEDKVFEITISKNKINITETEGPEAGKAIDLIFDAETSSWYLNDGNSSQLLATIDGDMLNLIQPNGKTLSIDIASN